MKKFTQEEKLTRIAVDSNIIIRMATVDENLFLEPDKQVWFIEQLRIMKRKCINGSLQIVITPTVMNELSRNMKKNELEFIQKYCLVVQPENKEQFAYNTVKLAVEYMKNGVIPRTGCSNDALIAAEAALCGLNLVTANVHHLVFYEEGEVSPDHKTLRNEDIQTINERSGLVFWGRSGEKFVPMPCTPDYYVEHFKEGTFSPIDYGVGVNYERYN